MLGMSGERLAMRVVARHADWWNCGVQPVDELRRRLEVLRGHCEAEGRDFASLRKTLNARVFLARSQAGAREMAAQRGARGDHPIIGDPAAVRDQFAELEALGFDLAVLTFPRFQELDDMRLFVDEVMPEFS
jgi:alkanesulfonate monooxygenase SsuD/methylene tetrahydromethanopterin reductase-like flavin-dependent oxidoreductase (luciferase family)